jgi:cytochrome c oxidase assembly protein subunit 11
MAERHNKRLLVQLSLAVVAMFGFGFALVPLYNLLCDITGINGKNSGLTQAAEIDYGVDENRRVTVQFVTTVNQGMPWAFEAVDQKLRVHPGELTTVQFRARNESGRDMIGQAVPSVRPADAAGYLRKTQCFCFDRQPLAAHETRTMPMRFVIDPELPDHVDSINLSYTFFDATHL